MITIRGLLLLSVKTIIFLKITRSVTHTMFVYGTLKRKEPNHKYLKDPENGVSKFIMTGRTKTKYPLVIATRYNVPYLLYRPGKGHQIEGEVFDVDDKMLATLDSVEDHPNYYERTIDDIIVTNKENLPETIKAWVYFLKKYKRFLLSREMFSNYSSNGAHGLPYVELHKRDPRDNYKAEVRDYNNK